METSTLLGLLDSEATAQKASNPGLSGLLYSAAEKIKALEAHAPGEKRVTLDDLADLKRGVEAGRAPSVQAAPMPSRPLMRF